MYFGGLMKIRDKINLDYPGLIENGPINIVIFGDSVSHGCFAQGEIDYEAVYWNKLRNKILEVRNYVPVNVINAAIGGITASMSLARMDKQVLSHNPDLIIVCFGLNDVNAALETYLNSMREIFEKSLASGAEVIFMTPNTFNTYVADDTPTQHYEYAKVTAEMQNNGKFDKYIYAAVDLAREMGVTVCDCYSAWKELAKTEDVTMLLANRINHPTKEMHGLFAQMLFDTIFEKEPEVQGTENTMYRG